MSSNTLRCVHCGAVITPNQQICSSCGCRPIKECTVTINRKGAFTGCVVPLVINIYNDSFNKTISIKNNRSQALTLSIGEYNFRMSLGVTTNAFKISIFKDTHFEASIQTGIFVNTLSLKEIL